MAGAAVSAARTSCGLRAAARATGRPPWRCGHRARRRTNSHSMFGAPTATTAGVDVAPDLSRLITDWQNCQRRIKSLEDEIAAERCARVKVRGD